MIFREFAPGCGWRPRDFGAGTRLSQKPDLLPAHAVAAARGIRSSLQLLPEVRGVEEPHGAAIRADEFRREVDEVSLLAEIVHIDGKPPWPRQAVRLQDVRVEPRHSIHAIGHAEEI